MQPAVDLSAAVDCLCLAFASEFGSVVAIESFASAILGIVSDQDGFDVVPATVHIVAATVHIFPGTASVLLRPVVELLLLLLVVVWVLVQEAREEEQNLTALVVMAVVDLR